MCGARWVLQIGCVLLVCCARVLHGWSAWLCLQADASAEYTTVVIPCTAQLILCCNGLLLHCQVDILNLVSPHHTVAGLKSVYEDRTAGGC